MNEVSQYPCSYVALDQPNVHVTPRSDSPIVLSAVQTMPCTCNFPEIRVIVLGMKRGNVGLTVCRSLTLSDG